MKKILLSVVIIITAIAANAQEQKLISFWRVSAGIAPVSIDYQMPLGESLVLHNSIGSGFYIDYKEGNKDDSHFDLYAHIFSELRYLYSYKMRIEKAKDTKFNSASYLGVRLRCNIDYYKQNPKDTMTSNIAIMGVWGLQRNLGSNFLFDFSFAYGPAYIFRTNKFSYLGEISIAFSYVF